MTDTVEISREDWDKLIGYHEELFKLLSGFDGELETVLLIDIPNLCFHISPEETAPITKKLTEYYAKSTPWTKFLFVKDEPFGIIPLKGGD